MIRASLAVFGLALNDVGPPNNPHCESRRRPRQIVDERASTTSSPYSYKEEIAIRSESLNDLIEEGSARLDRQR